MNTPLRRCLSAALLLATALFGLAQTPPVTGTARAIMETAKAQAKANNANAAEQALVQLNLAVPNTAEWRLETAQRLVQLAEQVSLDGAPGRIDGLVRSALQHLAQAERLATTPAAIASAKMQAG